MHEAARTPPFGPLIASSLLAGIVACLWLPVLPAWPFLALLMTVGLALWWRGIRGRTWQWRVWPGRAIGALLVGFGLAGLQAACGLAQQLPGDWERRDVVISGRIAEMPVHETRRTRFLFAVDDRDDQPAPLRGRQLRLAWYNDDPLPRQVLRAGQRWRFAARVRAPRGLRNPGGADTEKYALMQGIAATGYLRDPAAARLLSPASGLEAWRETVSERIAKTVPAASSRFLRALALGDTRGLSERDWEILRANGLTHLIAISGFHVGLVAGASALLARGLWWLWPVLGRRCPRPMAAAVAATLGAFAYTAVAGFALPTVRTWLMIALIAAVRIARRRSRSPDILALAAIVVLLIDPLAVLGAGFWLSFLGVAWLLWCLPQGEQTRGIAADARAFVSAQGVATLGLLPLCASLFGQASLAGPGANLVAVPIWSLIVVPLALAGTAMDAIRAGLGLPFWRLATQCFDAIWPLFERLAASPLALWWLPEAAWFALPLALIGAFWLLLPRGVPGKWLALLLWLPLLWPDRRLPAAGEVDISVIDVGQGLSLLVRTAHHRLLYDAGPAVRDGFDAGERAVVPALHAWGVQRLDAVVVSHADNDHVGGLDAVRRVFPAGPGWAPEGAQVPETRPCVAGQQWQWDGVRFRFLHPPRDFPYLGNEASCVLRIDSDHGTALLTGDIGEVIERRLVQRAASEGEDALRADVVVVAHHGSAGSSDPAFVAATGARYALVSSGHGNRFGHPKPAVLQRWRDAGAEPYDTAREGAVRVGFHRDGIRIERRRRSDPRLWDAARRAEAQATARP